MICFFQLHANFQKIRMSGNQDTEEMEVQIKLDQAKSTMEKSIMQAANNLEDIKHVEDLSCRLQSEADTFVDNSTAIKKSKCKELVKAKIVWFLLLFFCALMIVLTILHLSGIKIFPEAMLGGHQNDTTSFPTYPPTPLPTVSQM